MESPSVALHTGKNLSPLWRSSKKKASRAKINRCIANKVLYRKKRVDSGTKISVPEIRVVGTDLKNHLNTTFRETKRSNQTETYIQFMFCVLLCPAASRRQESHSTSTSTPLLSFGSRTAAVLVSTGTTLYYT
jgi:hypothetical protein